LSSGVFLRQRDLQGPDHIDTLDTQLTLATACNHLGRKAEAITRLQTRLESLTRIFGAKHIRTYFATLEVMDLTFPTCVQPFDAPVVNENANAKVAQILDDVKAVYGPLHPLAVAAIRKLGIFKSNDRNYTDAIDDLRSALGNAEKAWGPNHPQTAFCAAMIGCCYYRQQLHEQASPWLRRYLDFISSRNGDRNPEARAVLQLLAYTRLPRKKKDPAQALQDFERLSLAYEDQNCRDAKQTRDMANLMRSQVQMASRSGRRKMF
jgi:tetratricopeptide (TPR) repeat protein